MSGKIFISYRRGEDAAAAGRVYDRLERTFESQRVFMDVDSIPPGEDFVVVLKAQVAACDVLLALIGRSWLTAADKSGHRRLDNPDDFVRIEIASGLAQGKRVITVLIDDAMIPRANELPEELMPLVRRQAVRITQEHFREDAERLTRAVEKVLVEAEAKRRADEKERQRHQPEEAEAKKPVKPWDLPGFLSKLRTPYSARLLTTTVIQRGAFRAILAALARIPHLSRTLQLVVGCVSLVILGFLLIYTVQQKAASDALTTLAEEFKTSGRDLLALTAYVGADRNGSGTTAAQHIRDQLEAIGVPASKMRVCFSCDTTGSGYVGTPLL